jgi:cytochrome c biogenesis protein CcmG/thiol:disulfide interchange protein DsbE
MTRADVGSYARWVVAAAGALALAWLVVGAEMPWTRSNGAGHTAASTPGEACPVDAPPASFDFTLKNVENTAVNLADYKGKVVLLDFWATWCGPCKVEIPGFIDLQEKYGRDGLQVVGVSVDDTVDKLKPYVTEMKMNYPVLQGLGHDDLMDAFGPMLGIPVSVIISRDGRVCAKHTGLTSRETFEAQIKALL